MARPKRSPTWMEVAVKHAGMRKAVKAITWAYCWAVTREAIGHEPTVEEVGDWWNMSRRTAFRDQSAFRDSFPMLDSPAAMYDTEEARATMGKHADFGDRMDEWIDARRKGREQDALRAALAPAKLAG